MPTITSCATLGYAAFDLETALRQIARRGFRHVEITELGSYCRHFPYGEASAGAVRDTLARLGLTPVALNVSASRRVDGKIFRPRLADPSEAPGVVTYATWFLEQASALGIKVVSFPIGPRVDGATWKTEIPASVQAYRMIADTAARLGLSLNLEVPHLYQLTDSVDHVRAIFEALDHPAVGATVDTSHWGIIGYDLADFLSFLGPRLRHVHLRDSAGRDTRDFNQNLELTPGAGVVNFRAFGDALDRVGYHGEVSLELEHRQADLVAIESAFDLGLSHLKACGWELPKGVG
jgi:sugar phosphate isomerase/epimerase